MQTKEFKVNIPRQSYNKLLLRFGSEKKAIDMLELHIDSMLRAQRNLHKLMDEPVLEHEITFHVYQPLAPLLNDYSAENGKTISETLTEIIDKLCKRRR
jgi:hypothetical protein